jgi:hypothetical protein
MPYIAVEQPRTPYSLITSLLRHIRPIPQQRRAFPILRHDLTALERRPPARHTKRKDKQQGADSEREDPLKLEDGDLAHELTDTGSYHLSATFLKRRG